MRDVLGGQPQLVFGASGFLGRVIAARLLVEGAGSLVLPVRAHHKVADIQRAVAAEHPLLTVEQVQQQTQVLVLPESLLDLLPLCRSAGVKGIVNCAGSVAYFDREALTAGNEALTEATLALGAALHVEHYTYLSTAFSCGFRSGLVEEALHQEPSGDPTDYTASKRACEHLVARSGLPSLIARPAIVIGDSRTGRYTGRPYGIYQLWRGFERLLAHEWQADMHAVGSNSLLQLVHQDAVADGVVAALRGFEPGRVLHLVSDPRELPTVRQAWELWFRDLVRPAAAHFHESIEAATGQSLNKRQRVFLEFSYTNLEIAEQDWAFQTEGLTSLGLPVPVCSAQSLSRCQQAYIDQSPKLRAYLDRLDAPSSPLALG